MQAIVRFSGLCPICGEQVSLTGQCTADGRLIGTCQDAFTVAQWNAGPDSEVE
jgi:hypothetical protein